MSARPILHTSVAAALAWLAATELLGHPRPFFAPVAAVITLGLTLGQRRRRAVEMAFGVALGILVADMLVFLIGTGTWQIGVVTALAMGAALLLGGGPLLVSQAATSAVLVTTIQVPEDGISLARFLDALVGGAIALAVATLVLPVDPAHVVRRAVEPVLDAPGARARHRGGRARAARRGDGGDRDRDRPRDLADACRARRWPPGATPPGSRSGSAATASAWTATRRRWPRSSWR